MLAFLNIGPLELVLVLVIAVLVFGKDLPQAATKAYLQVRKLRSAVDELRRDSGIERELRNIERSVREAEWEARKVDPVPSEPRVSRSVLPAPVAAPVPEPDPPASPPSEPTTPT